MKWSNKKLKNYDVIVSLLLQLIFCIIILGVLLYLMISDCSIFLIFFSVLISLIFIYLLDYLIWQLKGYEINELNDNLLIIHRKGRLFNRKIKIKTLKIYSINFKKSKPKSLHSTVTYSFLRHNEMLGEKDGKIVIQTDKKGWFNINFGSGLTDDEAKHYVKEMIDYIESLKNNRLL